MDRLLDRPSRLEHNDLLDLAAVELGLDWQRRLRRCAVAGAIVTSVLCWAYSRFAIPALAFSSPLFAFFAVLGASSYFWERRLGGHRRRLLAELRPEIQRELRDVV